MDKKYHHGDLKIQLIKSGLQMVQEDGINKLSLRRLAQMCNVSEAAPYSHFKNKEELLIAIQEYVTQQLLKCLKDAYENTEYSNSPIAILNMGKAYVQFFINYPEYYSFLQEACYYNLSCRFCSKHCYNNCWLVYNESLRLYSFYRYFLYSTWCYQYSFTCDDW